MYAKLALKNVKKSFRDYAIYFLTLMFGVCVFYMFNSIESQSAMMRLTQAQDEMIKNLAQLMQNLSLFMAMILGFLIVYANKFLVKRRKKELGLYMLLGMDKWKISAVLVMETFWIGICSLVTGLLTGIFLSQGLSVFTAKLFEADMTKFSFVFSSSACVKTLVCFGVIYVVVILFNVGILSKCKLIELIYGDKRNEEPKIKNLGLSVVLFIISIICIGISYHCIIENKLMNIDKQFFAAFGFCFVGTVLFFMSLTGFFLKLIQTSKKGYYKDLNVFVLKQINSKINTNYISMIIVCLLLAVTIVSLSSGMAVKQSMTEELKAITPYDVSFIWEEWGKEKSVGNLEQVLDELGIQVEDYTDQMQIYSFYESPMTTKMILEGQELSGNAAYLAQMRERTFNAITVSEYNKAAVLQGKEKIALVPGEFAVNCEYQDMIPMWNNYLEKNKGIEYNGHTLINAYPKVLDMTLHNDMSRNNAGVIIVPDEIIDTTRKVKEVISFNYTTPELNEVLMNKLLSKDVMEKIEKLYDEDIYINDYTKSVIYEASIGLSAMVVYVTVYIAIVFLITSAAILALQQLTEAEDNKKRYELLAKLGADEKMIHQALFKQIGIYFIVPLSLALVHSVVGIYVANMVIRILGEVNVLQSIILTAGIFVIIYGGYFVATYYSSKNLINRK